MFKLQRMALWLSVLSAAAALHISRAQAAPLGPGVVGCAVAEAGQEIDAEALCQRFSAELGQTVVRVEDARVTRVGTALQVVRGDVEWFVAWLHDGEITAWTRVSEKTARGNVLETLVDASRSLALRARELDGHCIEMGRILERATSSSDLVYPWQELYPCKGHTTDVVDPWLARR